MIKRRMYTEKERTNGKEKEPERMTRRKKKFLLYSYVVFEDEEYRKRLHL